MAVCRPEDAVSLTFSARPRTGKPVIAGISYLNARPYFYPLLNGLVPCSFQIELMTPAEANAKVLSGKAIGGLISSVAWAKAEMSGPMSGMSGDRLIRLSGFDIASIGPVRSILLYSRKAFDDILSVAVTVESETSVGLLKILLRDLPESPGRKNSKKEKHETGRSLPARIFSSVDPLSEMTAGRADGALLIGDAALASTIGSSWEGGALPTGGPAPCRFNRWDLGELWFEMTGLPMVYAVLAVRKEHGDLVEKIQAEFRTALDWSREHLDEIIRERYNSALSSCDDLKGYLENFDRAREREGDDGESLERGLNEFLDRLGDA